MPYSGVVATIFAAVEPSLAVCIACAPFLRSYFNGGIRNNKADCIPELESGPGKSVGDRRNHVFESLDDDGSDIQLQPIN